MNRSPRWVHRLAALLTLLFLAVAGAQGTSYTCDARFYQIRQPTGSTGSNLFILDHRNLASGGVAQWASPSSLPLNALSYNKADGYFYATNYNPITTGGTPYRLYRLGMTGPVEVASLTLIPNASQVAAGTVDASGKMYIKLLQSDNKIYTVQLPTSASSTAIGSQSSITLTTSIPLADMAFDPVTNKLYGVYTANIPTTNGTPVGGVVYKIDPASGALTVNGSGPTVSASNAIGSVFFDISGTLYAYQNGGAFGTINLNTGEFTRLTAASTATASDGASCVFPDERISGSKVAGKVVAISSTVFDVPYSVTVTNNGPIPDRNVQVTENLSQTFSAGSPTLAITSAPTITSVTSGTTAAPNSSFNGTTDTRLLVGTNPLPIGASIVIGFTVRVTYPSVANVPASGSPVNNVVYSTSTSTGPNDGYTFPTGAPPLPPVDLLATNTSTPSGATMVGNVNLGISKTGPSTAVAGTTVSYVLTLSNAGPSSANAATFSDPVPSSLTGVTAVCQNTTGGVTGCSATVGANNLVTGSVGTFPSGGTVQVLITGTVPAAASGSLTNTATITAPSYTTDTDTTNNTSATVTTSITKTADLAIDKSGPVAVGDGKSFSYTVRVWNNGPSTVSGVAVNETLPGSLTVTGVTCTATGTATCGTSTFTASSVSLTTGTLSLDSVPANTTPDGNSLTYTVTGTAPTSGVLSNTASLTVPGGVTDPTSSNNTSTAVQTRVINAVNDASVTLASGAGGTVAVLGNDTNGSVAATTSNSTVSVSNNGGISGLSVNASGQLVVPASQVAGSYTVTYQLCDLVLTSACDTATVPISINALTPDLAVTISGPTYAKPSTVASSNPPVSASTSTITYTLAVSVTKANATGTTTVTTTLPSALSWTASGNYTASGWTCTITGQLITCTTTSSIVVGTAQSITLSSVVVAAGTAGAPSFTTTVAVSNAGESSGDAAVGNASSATTKLILTTVSKEVRNVTADLRDNAGAARFGTTGTGLPNELLEYCIDTKNLGGVDLPKYILTDVLDGNSQALTSVTSDSAYSSKAIKWTRVTPGSPATTTTGSYTAVAGDDNGTLNTSLTMNLGTLLAGETVRTCFQVRVR